MFSMKRLVLFLCFFVAFSQYGLPARSGTVYVSSSCGIHESDGLDPDHPTSNLSGALKNASVVLLKAGDVFYRGNLQAYDVTVSRYGEGVNPLICGYKRIAGAEWYPVRENVWAIDLLDDGFSGYVTAGPSISNNICAIHDYNADLVHGRKVWKEEELTRDWDFWQTEDLTGKNPASYNMLYLYLTSDPNDSGLELSVYDTALSTRNATVDGVNFVGFGFGISAWTNTKIRNCRIDVIGGRIYQEGDTYNCMGNGIEFFVSTDISDCVVEDCYVSRCYDCGITIQGSRGGRATPRNIIIQNNLIANCCQGWEDFLRNDPDVVFDNCVFCGNTVLHSGNTSGFGYNDSRFKYCHVLGNNVSGDRGMQILDNVFCGGNFYCSGSYNDAYKSNIWSGNECFLSSGDFVLGEYFGRKDVIRMNWSRLFSSGELRLYRELTGDSSTVFHVVSRRRIDNKASRLMDEFLQTHSY